MPSLPHCHHVHSAPGLTLEHIHDSHRPTAGMHLCAGIAYDSGFNWGREHPKLPELDSEKCQEGFSSTKAMIDELPECQVGPGRHKCVICAYHRGFEAARAAG